MRFYALKMGGVLKLKRLNPKNMYINIFNNLYQKYNFLSAILENQEIEYDQPVALSKNKNYYSTIISLCKFGHFDELPF